MEYRVSKKSVLIWQIRATLLLAIAGILSGAIGIFSSFLFYFLLVCFFTAYLFFVLWYLPKSQKSLRIFLSEQRLLIRHGVFICKADHFECTHIIYTEVSRTPLQRMFGTCTITLHTAGAQKSLHNLSKNTGFLLRRELYRSQPPIAENTAIK